MSPQPNRQRQTSSSSSGDTDTPRSDAEVRAEDQARVGRDGDAVEHRAVTSRVQTINRRAQAPEGAKFAETRGVYRDPVNGARRIVGAGQAIPDGWDRVESASLADRGVENAREAHAAGERIGSAQGAAPEAEVK
jgi:hypothetical protein